MRRGVRVDSVIYTKTLTLADTWYKVAGEISPKYPVISWYLKPREATDNAFDYTYEDNPSSYLTNSGQGVRDDTDLKEIWVRSTVSGTVMELEVKLER